MARVIRRERHDLGVRWLVYGAGAVGGVVGGRLAEAGHDVVLVARGAHAAAMRRDGLRIDSPAGSVTLPLPVVTHPREAGVTEGDVVLLAMKSQDTVAALEALRDAAPPATPVVCLQNGVDNERQALRRFPHVYGVCVMCPTGHLEPGVVEAYSSPCTGILDVGRYPAGVDEAAERVAEVFRAATFSSEARLDIARWKWAKLLTNLGNAVEALCGPDARASRLAGLVRDEGVACLRAAGIDAASPEEDAARRADLLDVRPVGGRRRGGGSSWQSLQRQAGAIETDHLNGEIVLLGRLHAVPTPANALVQRLANEAAAAATPPGAWREDDLLALLERN